jgi:DNA-binding XRE family transcriptional regulator
MGAKVSAEMLKAKHLVLEKGYTAAAAAKAAGISKQAIYLSRWYRDDKSRK